MRSHPFPAPTIRQADWFLKERLDANIGGNVIVNTHYPTDYIRWGGTQKEKPFESMIRQV